MATHESVNAAIIAINTYQKDHPVRTATWAGQVIGVVGVKAEDGTPGYGIGISESTMRPHTALYDKRISRILASKGLADVSVHVIEVDPYYLDPNWQ